MTFQSFMIGRMHIQMISAMCNGILKGFCIHEIFSGKTVTPTHMAGFSYTDRMPYAYQMSMFTARQIMM